VFPPTYNLDGKPTYAHERRRLNGSEVDAVLLDAVQSQANRMEQALLQAWHRRELSFPVVAVDFSGIDGLADLGQITSLDAPHRLADALIRDSVSNGKLFRLTPEGMAFTGARINNATGLYRLCPTGLVFGLWDSTDLRRPGGGAKFARALVSEIVGIGAVSGTRTSSRIDPAGIMQISKDSPIYRSSDPMGWTRDAAEAQTEKGKPLLLKTGRPSEINHGNITPSIDDRAGGVTVDYALQTVVLSLAALRRLRFGDDVSGQPLLAERRDVAESSARTALAALGLAAVAYQEASGYDLRSRCVLEPESPLAFEVLSGNGNAPTVFTLDRASAAALFKHAVDDAREQGMAWACEPAKPILTLTPAPKLAGLILRSRELAATGAAAE
jgi:CRISPR-associated protein Csb1